MKALSVKDMSRFGVSKAVRDAEKEPVLISRDNEPAVWMVSAQALRRVMEHLGSNAELIPGVAALIAVHLFEQGALSMGQAARASGLSLADFIALCDRMQVPVLCEPDQGVADEVDAFDRWLQSIHLATSESPSSGQ